MSEAEAKEQLNLILESFTVGGILNLLADIYREMADDAQQDNDAMRRDQCSRIESTLIVVGSGCDANLPQ